MTRPSTDQPSLASDAEAAKRYFGSFADDYQQAFVGGGRVAVDFGSNVTATVAYRGVLAGNRNDHAASATLSVKF